MINNFKSANQPCPNSIKRMLRLLAKMEVSASKLGKHADDLLSNAKSLGYE